MSKESYARGFCKAAEAAGVDPVALSKYASDVINNFYDAALKTDADPEAIDYYSLSALNPEVIHSAKPTVGEYLSSMYSVNPDAATMALSRNNFAAKDMGEEIPKDLISSVINAAGKFPTSVHFRTGDYNDALARTSYSSITNLLNKLYMSGRLKDKAWDVENARATRYGMGIPDINLKTESQRGNVAKGQVESPNKKN